VHDYDTEVDDLSRGGQAKNIARLHKALDALTAIDPETLAAGDRDDREMLINSIKGRFLTSRRSGTGRRTRRLRAQRDLVPIRSLTSPHDAVTSSLWRTRQN
jgi:hypothetical protein